MENEKNSKLLINWIAKRCFYKTEDKFKNSLVKNSSIFNAFLNVVAISSLLNPSGIVIQISVGPFFRVSII
jgi:uncharacterized membrane protein